MWVAGRVSDRKGMGATLTAVIVGHDKAHVASVGDSRAYILRENRIRQITKDQSYVAVLVKAGVAEEDARRRAEKQRLAQIAEEEARRAREERRVAIERQLAEEEARRAAEARAVAALAVEQEQRRLEMARREAAERETARLRALILAP